MITIPEHIRRHWCSLSPTPADFAPTRRSWRRDLFAGLTVGVVALPLALGFGVSSGLGAAAGIVTAIIAGVVAAIFGGSNVQVSGPTGAMVVVLAPIVANQGPHAVLVVTIMAGIVLVAAGLLRLGRVVVYIPWSVIEGFTAGIALVIFVQQVPLAVDASANHGEKVMNAAWDALTSANWSTAWLPLAVTVGVICIVELFRLLPGSLPGALIAVVGATFVAEHFALPVSRIGALPSSLPAPAIPLVDWTQLGGLVGPAIAVAALAAIESLLSARVAAGMAPTGRVLPDREIVGQGLASIASALFGGMPATGAIARTAVNVRAGAKSRLAAITHSVILALVVAFGAGMASRIPLAALAGVLMSTAIHMVNPKEVLALIRVSRAAATTFVVTIICTVFLDLITAVEIGVALAAFFALRTLASTTHVVREEIPGPAQPGDEHIAVLTMEGSLFFGVADRVLDDLAEFDAWVVVLRLSGVGLLDSTGARRLAEQIKMLESHGVHVLVKGLRPAHLKIAEHSGLLEALDGRSFATLDQAVASARSLVEARIAAAARHRGLGGASEV